LSVDFACVPQETAALVIKKITLKSISNRMDKYA
jgi:hypothetical protein